MVATGAHIIFHHPKPILSGGESGSQVRPYRMLQAFRSSGYEVEVVAGHGGERRRAIERVVREARMGRRFAFSYAESSTEPALLTERHHLPTRPLLDFGFFRWLNRQEIPLGLFYRDVMWRFDHYRMQVPWFKRAVAIPFYHYEWRRYRERVDHLFLPSLRMKEALPTEWPGERLSALPPGCELHDVAHRGAGPADDRRLALLYVGGVTPPLYDLRPALDAVRSVEGVVLTICCRRAEWERARSRYGALDGGTTEIVHARGDDLARHYAKTHAVLAVLGGYAYLDFAVPLKLYEALSHGVPIVASAGTEAGRVVAEEDVGWVVADREGLRRLLRRLRAEPEMLAGKRRRVLTVRERHTWQVRARVVAEVLQGGRRGRDT